VLRRVATAHEDGVRRTRKFGFKEAGTDPGDVIADPSIDLVFVRRGTTHATLVADALRAGKHVFVEKPLAIDHEQLLEVEQAAAASTGVLLVGFNRRFSPLAVTMREALEGRGPIVATYRVNAGPLPLELAERPGRWRWTDHRRRCHFIDFLAFLTGDAVIDSVEARCAGRPHGPAEDVVIQLGFADGSVGQVLYTAKGDPALGKERIEAHAGGLSVVLDDFRSVEIMSGGKRRKDTAGGKGHAEELTALLAALRSGGPSPISLASLLATTRATLRA
jgi:polar amino acid transport system substrate-binding protein